jgi:hypothetical protein
LIYYGNRHAKRVVELTAQLWLHIPISFETVKVGELRLMTIDALLSVIHVTRNSTKARNFQKPKGLRCGRKLTAKQ